MKLRSNVHMSYISLSRGGGRADGSALSSWFALLPRERELQETCHKYASRVLARSRPHAKRTLKDRQLGTTDRPQWDILEGDETTQPKCQLITKILKRLDIIHTSLSLVTSGVLFSRV